MADFNQATSSPVALSTPVTIPPVGQSVDASAAGIFSIFEQIVFDGSVSGKLMGSVTGQTVRAGGFVMPTTGQLWELGIPMQGITAPVRTTDVDAAAQIDRIEAAEAVTLSNPVRAAMNQLVVDLKAAGVYSKLRYMMLSLGMPTIAGCRVPFVDKFLNYAPFANANTITGNDYSVARGLQFPQSSGFASPSPLTALQAYGPGPVRSDVSVFVFYTSPGAVSGGTGFSSIIYGPDDFPNTRGFFLGMANSNSTANFNRYENSGQPISNFLPEPNYLLFLGTMSGTSEAWLHRNTWATSNASNNQFSDSLADPVTFMQINEVASGQESLRFGAAGYAAAMSETEARAFQTALQTYRLAIAAATVGEEPVIDVPFDNSTNNYAGNGIVTTTVNAVTITAGEGVFNGSGSYFKIGPESTASTLLDLSTTDFTVDFEITRVGTASNQRIFTQQRVNNNGTFLIRTAGTNGNNCEVLFLINPSTVIGSLVVTDAWPLLNRKYKVSVELVGTLIRVMIDGLLKGTAYLTGTRFATGVDNGTWIGSFHSAGEVLNGRLDNLKLWRSARYASISAYRYWRLTDFAVNVGAGFLDWNEIQFAVGPYDAAVVSSTANGASVATTSIPSYAAGTIALLNDNNTGTRVAWTTADAQTPTFNITIDLNQARRVTHWRQNYGGAGGRFAVTAKISGSNDGTNFMLIKTLPAQSDSGQGVWGPWVDLRS